MEIALEGGKTAQSVERGREADNEGVEVCLLEELLPGFEDGGVGGEELQGCVTRSIGFGESDEAAARVGGKDWDVEVRGDSTAARDGNSRLFHEPRCL